MTRTESSHFAHPAAAMAMAAMLGMAHSGAAAAAEEAQIHGKTYGEWSAGWWQWQEANYPDFSFGTGAVDCSRGQSGPVWFLGGTGGGAAERECMEPLRRSTHLFIPLVNANVFNPDAFCAALFSDPNCTVDQKREVLDGLFSEEPAGVFDSVACDLQIYVDGDPAAFDTPIVRTQSPTFDYATDEQTVAEGFWVMLEPLSSGDHVIEFSGGICHVVTGESLFRVDVTYFVTVK